MSHDSAPPRLHAPRAPPTPAHRAQLGQRSRLTALVHVACGCPCNRAARLKLVEAEKAAVEARAEAAERVLAKGESKDQARMETLTDESRASRLKFLALSERLRQLTRLRETDAQDIATLRAQLEDRDRRIIVLEGGKGARGAGPRAGSRPGAGGGMLPVKARA